MSTYSLAVSGPSPTLAYLRALALKASRTTGKFLTTVRLSLATGGRLIRTTATTALAVIGSDAGYDLARRGIRYLVTTAAGLVGAATRAIGRGLRALGRWAGKALGLISRRLAEKAHDIARTWILEPITRAYNATVAWLTTAGEVLWHITGTALVRTVTTFAAQTAGLLLGLHTLTQGALAARIVTALPAAMSAVAWITQPLHALAVVAAAFLTAGALAAAFMVRGASRPDPDQPHDLGLIDPHTPDLVAERPRPLPDGVDMNRIAASLNVEITPNGSVVVHGIPEDLDDDTARQIAQTAASAATDRLRRVLMTRRVPNRDDRRLITKVAREAVRRAA